MSAATTTTVESIWQSPVSAALEATSSPTVSGSEPVTNSTNVRRDTPIAAYVNLPNVGHGVDKLTLKGNVRLYKASDASKTPIPGEPNTTGGGDAIIFTPSALLDANTKYTFEVTSGVKDTAGAAFKPYAMSFTTGTAGAPTASNIAFNKVALSNATGKRFTGVTIGPDGKLYAGTMSGEIVRWNINADGTLSSTTTINTIKSGNGGQSRIVTGIRFDPSSTSTNLILWVTHGHGAEEGAPNWTGKLTRLTGSSLGTYQDYVTGLPRSVRDHLTNQIDFDAERRLYISQGSQNAMGAPDNAWGQRPEVLLSAAILRVDYNAIAARIASGQGPLNVKTSDGGTYSPYAPGAAVTLYATGVRNAYDLLWHSNGNLYAPTNGSAPGGNTPAGGGAPGLKNVQQNEPDWLFKIRKDKYYGHPNPTRQEYVLNGGNPTSGTDKYQVNAYPVGTKPDADWDPAIYSFGANRSPNGVIEYKSGTFGGALKGNLLVVRYSGGDDVIALAPDAGGNISSTGVKTGLSGLTGFVDPLDLVEHVGPGNLYVIEHGAQKITLLRPKGSTGGGGGGTPGTDAPVRNPNVVYFNDPVGGTASPARTLKIRNSGGSAFNINEISLAGTDASMFRIVSKPALPKSLAGGTTQDITVEFNPPAGSALGLRKAQVVVKTSSSTTPQLTYDLRALATAGLTGANEPSLQRILDLFQLPINAGDANPSTSDMPLPLASGNDNVSLERLVKAGSGNVTIEPLAVFASSGQPTIKFGWYPGGNSGSLNQVATFTDSQSVNPGLTSGSFNFDPGSGSFGLYTVAPAFGTRVTYSEASKNTWEPVSANRDKMLLFPLKDKNGNVVPNAYVMGWEEVSGSYDYQDFLAVIRNVRDPNSVPPPPPPNEGVGTITGLTLVNADNDQPIGPFENNTTINYGAFNTKAVTVRADTIGNIGSVRWGLDANANFRTENFAPYAIGGDQNTTDLLPFNVPMGTHTLTATAYSGPDGTGEVLKTITYTFHVADVPVVAPSGGRIVGLTLVNADNDQPIGPFENNTTIHYAAMGVKNVTVRAETDGGTIGSVRWGLDGNGNFRTENFAPFAIGGDVNTTDLLPFSVAPGSHQLTVIAYGGRDATGPILSQLTLTFHVADTPA